MRWLIWIWRNAGTVAIWVIPVCLRYRYGILLFHHRQKDGTSSTVCNHLHLELPSIFLSSPHINHFLFFLFPFLL